VGRAAREPRSSITYYFGDKQGLITALIEAQLHVQRTVAARILSGPGEGDHCATGAVCAARQLLSDMTSFRVFYDLLPVVTREPQFNAMQVEHDRWVTARIREGLWASDDTAVAAQADLLAAMELAAADGQAMQVLTDPKGFDPTPSCAMLERLITEHIPADDGSESVVEGSA
jgi:AcrR family transcriptional regulator